MGIYRNQIIRKTKTIQMERLREALKAHNIPLETFLDEVSVRRRTSARDLPLTKEELQMLSRLKTNQTFDYDTEAARMGLHKQTLRSKGFQYLEQGLKHKQIALIILEDSPPNPNQKDND